MPLKNTIGAKIFGLAVVLLLLTVVLVSVLLWQVVVLNGELGEIATRFVPLTSSVANLNEYGLRRRLAFERWLAAGRAGHVDTAIVAEARTNYTVFTDRLQIELTRAGELAAQPSDRGAGRETLTDVRSSLRQIVTLYAIITREQHDVLDLTAGGQTARADDILHALNDTQRAVQEERERIQQLTQGYVQASTLRATARQEQVVWISAAATVSAVLLGLALSALVTRRLVRPVRSLIAGIKTAQTGDFTGELPVQSSDEVGDLTRAFNYFVRELRTKEQIKRTFGKYIDPRILEKIILQTGTAGIDGGRHTMSVSFSDLVGFTGLGELLTPAGMVNVLNRHFGLQAEAIQSHRGVVDKFMGDAVMAFWGPPFSADGEHAREACRSALDQLRLLDEFRSLLPELTGLRKNLPVIDLRIGICTGEMIAGNLGSENTRSFTVIGDAVNIASRLEGANRTYGTRILASESTVIAAGSGFVSRELDTLVVKGKTESHRVFEILGLAGEAPPDWHVLCERFASALSWYRAGRWDEAEAALRGCLEVRPDDGPSLLFLDRVGRFREQPPPPGWNGVFHLDSK